VNCDNTKMSVIDMNGTFSLFKLNKNTFSTTLHQAGTSNFERKDVWDMMWATDNPELFAIMEKTRMYIFRGTDPEEPVTSAAHLCSFKSLKIKAVSLDDIMMDPEHPQKELFVAFETKSLRDTRELLKNVSLKDAFQFVEDNPHKKLWRLLASDSLDKGDFVVAEKCFVRCKDYQAIQFVKRLRTMDDPQKQRAEILVYFARFDDAEKVFKEMDRKDLVAEMRMRLGDWFKVVQLVQEGGGDDALVQYAWDQLGDYYWERQKWSKAVQYYSQAKKYEKLIPLYFLLEDYRSLTRLIDFVVDTQLLIEIGRKLVSVGLSESAVEAFTKAGEVKMAVDSCIELNQWDMAIQLAEKYKLSEIAQYLGKYATHLVEKDKIAQAIELYKRAGRYVDSAKLLVQLAQRAEEPLRAKKLYVLSALDVDRFKRKQLDATRTASQLVDGLLTAESATSLEKGLQNPWHGAEAWHFYMLCQRQLYEGNIPGALVTATRLPLYEGVINEVDVYSILAVCSFYAQNFAICSKAFVRLEAIDNAGSQKEKESATAVPSVALDDTLDLTKGNIMGSLRAMTSLSGGGGTSLNNYDLLLLGEKPKRYQDLAVKIFSRNPPVDVAPSNNAASMSVSATITLKDWTSLWNASGGQGQVPPVCVASGRPVYGKSVVCRVCKHHMLETEMIKFRNCPLCHTPREGLREGAPPRS